MFGRDRMEKAIVTVLMTTYNETTDLLSSAIDSIINQSIKNIEMLIIVDNAKNIEAITTIEKYINKDKRIRYLINETNLGLAEALNKGIDCIQTKYIARMDADDISLPKRLEKQIEYMEKYNDTALLGCNIIYVDKNNKEIAPRGSIPSSYRDIRYISNYQNIMSHPTFLGKTEIFKQYHYRNLKYSQDYDFTCRLLENGEIVRNIPDYLLRYRVNPDISIEKKVKQIVTRYIIREAYREKKLSGSDICKRVEEELSSIDEEQLFMSIEKYDKSVNMFKDGHSLKAMLNLFMAGLKNKIIFAEITNAMVLYFNKKKWE